jgi:hypothetical protein
MFNANRRGLASTALALAALASSAAPALAGRPSGRAAQKGASVHALLSSRELWATIDVCSPMDQPNTVGIRGSMPGDNLAHDRMYMSFRLQYLTATGQWLDLVSGATPVFAPVGAGATPRQSGRSFQLVPVPGKPSATLRGVVDFQWRRGSTIIAATERPTTVGHVSLAGADPATFSAASCVIG